MDMKFDNISIRINNNTGTYLPYTAYIRLAILRVIYTLYAAQ